VAAAAAVAAAVAGVSEGPASCKAALVTVVAAVTDRGKASAVGTKKLLADGRHHHHQLFSELSVI
jgi:hypothetical protein